MSPEERGRLIDLRAVNEAYKLDISFRHLRDGGSRFVPGEGNLSPRVVFVGEAPGAKEDKARRPFVGPSGILLNSLMEEISLSREDAFITNIVKYRPPQNRDPSPQEIELSMPYLLRELSILRTDHNLLVVTLGRHALRSIFPGMSISDARRATVLIRGSNVIIPTYHPAATFRHGSYLEYMRADFQKLKELLSPREE